MCNKLLKTYRGSENRDIVAGLNKNYGVSVIWCSMSEGRVLTNIDYMLVVEKAHSAIINLMFMSLVQLQQFVPKNYEFRTVVSAKYYRALCIIWWSKRTPRRFMRRGVFRILRPITKSLILSDQKMVSLVLCRGWVRAKILRILLRLKFDFSTNLCYNKL